MFLGYGLQNRSSLQEKLSGKKFPKAAEILGLKCETFWNLYRPNRLEAFGWLNYHSFSNFDWYIYISLVIARMATQIENTVKTMSDKFDKLSSLQGDALSRPLEQQHDEIRQQFAEITKTDVSLNNLLVRARTSNHDWSIFPIGVPNVNNLACCKFCWKPSI